MSDMRVDVRHDQKVAWVMAGSRSVASFAFEEFGGANGAQQAAHRYVARDGADAPLTPDKALSRCPEVQALVEALSWYRGNVAWCNNFGPEGTEARDRLAKDIGIHAEAALAPFTEGTGNG